MRHDDPVVMFAAPSQEYVVPLTHFEALHAMLADTPLSVTLHEQSWTGLLDPELDEHAPAPTTRKSAATKAVCLIGANAPGRPADPLPPRLEFFDMDSGDSFTRIARSDRRHMNTAPRTLREPEWPLRKRDARAGVWLRRRSVFLKMNDHPIRDSSRTLGWGRRGCRVG